MGAFTELTGAGMPRRRAATLSGVSRATADRATRARRHNPTRRPRPVVVPANRLRPTEAARVLGVLHSPEFVDRAPTEIYATLLGRGEYLCSVATMYRILSLHNEIRERRRLATHPARAVPELVASGPGQVYSWDITKLPGPTKGAYFDAYVMIDIFSRYIVGVKVHARETGPLAETMMREVFAAHGVPHVVHADRGTAMTSKTVAQLLEDLDVTRSHSRPRVSNDNPYSEALFKTVKYAPAFPERFANLAAARAHMNTFTTWYNHHHHHAGIGLHTPADVHHHRTETVDATRRATLTAARAQHPERFASSTAALPKALLLPTSAWINQPLPADAPQPADAAA